MLRTLLLLCALCASLRASDFVPRLDIDPALQGVWFALVVSEDGGATTSPVNLAVCRVTALTATVSGADAMTVKSVGITTGDDGKPGNMIVFNESNVIWAVSSTDLRNTYLVQFFHPNPGGVDGYFEKMRYVIQVRR